MSSILGTLFGKTSKESSSSTSNSHSGNYAFPFLMNSLAPTTSYLSKGGDMLGAMLGVGGTYAPSNSPVAQQTAPTVYQSPVMQEPVNLGDFTPAPSGNSVQSYYQTFLNGGGFGTYEHPLVSNQEDYASNGNYGDGALGQRYLQNLTAVNHGEQPAYTIDPGLTYQPPAATYSNPAPAPQYAPAGSQQDALNSFASSGGMDFLREQGIRAIEASQAGKGILNSGGTGIALEKYGQGLAQTYLNQYMDQLLNYSKLGAQGAGILADAGNYSDGMVSSSSSGKGGKQGLVQALLGGSGAGPAVAAALA
jgi:hypothetical protein